MLPLLAMFAVTFNRDVAPIINQHCVECHRQGEIGPFPLVTYQDAAPRAKLIARSVAKREMPPWLPVHGYGRFAGERRLTQSQIAILQRWAAEGAREGTTPAPPPAARPGNWKLGEPDLIVEMPEPYAVQAEGGDAYRCFVLPVNLAVDRWVRAVDFQPSNRRVVHHALFFTTAQKLPANYSCFGTPGFLPSSTLGGWSPGNSVLTMPAGTAMRLPKGNAIVAQIHFHPRGHLEEERSRIGIYFAAGPPEKHIADVGLVSKRIDIAPGERNFKVRDHFEIPIDVHALGIIPHAHYLCRDMKGWAIFPSGKKLSLLWIDRWNFDWQDRYWYEKPIALPSGTRVKMEFTYDNSAGNPHNPNFPPQRVTWGGESTDEMAGLHIQVTADREEDLPELGRALWGKIVRMTGGHF